MDKPKIAKEITHRYRKTVVDLYDAEDGTVWFLFEDGAKIVRSEDGTETYHGG